MKIMQFYLLMLGLVPLSQAANILVVVPLPAKSHSIMMETLVNALLENGHNVTYITTFPLKKTHLNLTTIPLTVSMGSIMERAQLNFTEMSKGWPLGQLLKLENVGVSTCALQLAESSMQNFLASNSSFDLLIVQAFLSDSIMAGLSYKFNAPLIGFTTYQPTLFNNYLVGNVAPTSYIPDIYLRYSQRMTFFQRLNNLLVQTIVSMVFYSSYYPAQERIYHNYFGRDAPPMMDVLRNTAVLFTYDHYTLSFPRPQTPNTIPVGGLHVPPGKQLDGDLKEIMDKGIEGVVLFSLGTNLKSSEMSSEKLDMFVKVFMQLKLVVLWKFEGALPNKPNNVYTMDWIPQSDVLAHKNLKLFITHGGLLSTTEAVVRGVPVIGIPFFADQYMNLRLTVNAGMGLMLNIDEITESNLLEAINEVVYVPKYKEAAVLRSQVLQAQPLSPLKTALFWINHVLQFKGTAHLKSEVQNLTWYQAYQIDVILFICMVLVVLIFSTVLLFRWVIRIFFYKTIIINPVNGCKKEN